MTTPVRIMIAADEPADVGPDGFVGPSGPTCQLLSELDDGITKVVFALPSAARGDPRSVFPLPFYESKGHLLRSPVKLLRTVVAIRRCARTCDVTFAILPYGAGIIAACIARLGGRPLAIAILGDLPTRTMARLHHPVLRLLAAPVVSAYSALERWLVHETPTMIASYALAAKYRNERGSRFAPFSSVAATDIRTRDHFAGATPVITFVGRVDQMKGADVLHRAFTRLGDRPCQLRIIGIGPMAPAYAALASRDPRVHCLGYLTQEQVLKELRNATMLIVPSITEGLPRVILEAWSQGCAVIASDIPPLRMLSGGSAAVLVPSGDAAALSEAIVRLGSDLELRRSTTDAGYQRVRSMTRDVTLAVARRLLREACGPLPRDEVPVRQE